MNRYQLNRLSHRKAVRRRRAFRLLGQTSTTRILTIHDDHGSLVISGRRSNGGLIRDPATAWAYLVRAALAPPDPMRMPGVCVIRDGEGAVTRILDPITRATLWYYRD